jgi:YggT family protein
MILLAVTRDDVARYVSAVFTVYIVFIFLYILLNLAMSFGLRLPYSRWTDAFLSFLKDICDPYLRLFRRLLPSLGNFDFTPMIAIIVLYIAQRVVVDVLIR